MISRRISIAILLLCCASVGARAQRSGVFVGGDALEREGYDRPPRMKLLKPFAPTMLPQSVEPHPDTPADFPNINVSYWLRADQDEPSLAINPTDPNNIILSCNDYRSDSSLWYFVSKDGGVHWDSQTFISNAGFSGTATDPGVTFDADGRAFVSYGRAGGGLVLPPMYQINDVVCFSSSNKGDSWIGPVRIILDSDDVGLAKKYADKYYIATDLDPASPNHGNVYVTWAMYEAGKSSIMVSHSTDHGATWSAAIKITTSANFQAPIPIVEPGGDVIITYEDIDPNHRQIRSARSTDGGKTFANDVLVTTYNDLGRLYPSTGSRHPVIKGHVRVNSFPSIAVDRSTKHPGRLYLTYASLGADLRQHIYLTTSDDHGAHWSAPLAVEHDLGSYSTDKFFPWIAVDPSNGDIGIVYYDSRIDSIRNELIDAFMLFSSDGGANFTPLRLTKQSFDTKPTSSRDTVGSSTDDSLTFIGDYLSIDGRNKHWIAAWTDTRSGYDQDVYVALVRPYAPAAVRNFQVAENASTHHADLSWQYVAATTAGMPLGSYQFHLRRSDGGLDSMLSSSTLAFTDITTLETSSYHYSIQVVTSESDTSATAHCDYYPRRQWVPQPPTVVGASAQPNGFGTLITIPSKTASGESLHGLYRIFYILDGVTVDSADVHDSQQGKTVEPFRTAADGFHKFQVAVSVQLPSGDTVMSALSEPHWLYAGAPRTAYMEDFAVDNTTFTIFAWSLTNLGGTLPTMFINDSLPFVNYQAGSNTWFCLPPVTISDQTKTLEFDHIATVTTADSAWVEYSLDDGISFQPLAEFDTSVHPNSWKHSLFGSTPVHEKISVKNFIGKDLIARFRLQTTTSMGDGWYLRYLTYTSALGVNAALPQPATDELRISENPVNTDGARAHLVLRTDARVTIELYDMLGRKTATAIDARRLVSGEYEMNIPGVGPGTYTILCRLESGASVRNLTARMVVIR